MTGPSTEPQTEPQSSTPSERSPGRADPTDPNGDTAPPEEDATAKPAIADDSESPDESGTPTGDDLGAGGD